MRKQITNLLVAFVAAISITTSANAQQIDNAQTSDTQQRTQMYVAHPQTQNQFYFGMSLELNRNWSGTTLRIVSVTPGSPAQIAGLEIGDEIRTVNGRGFEYANDSFQAVSMMNQFVNNGGAAPAAATSASAQTMYVMPQPPQPIARMIVRNVRNGQNVFVTVRPIRRGGFPGPAPAAAAAMVAGG